MIAVLDYGAGNLRSVENSLAAIGVSYAIIRDAEGVRRAGKIMLPGVGHFGQMMSALDQLGVRETLKVRVASGVPLLGICLGLQALYEASAEAPGVPGLGIISGEIIRFPDALRVPHMGWNHVTPVAGCRLFSEPAHFYFANSYYAPVGDATSATCSYSREFSAAVERDNVFAVQFHPEKSGAAGLDVLRRFAAL